MVPAELAERQPGETEPSIPASSADYFAGIDPVLEAALRD